METAAASLPFRRHIVPLLLLCLIFFSNFASRVIIAPMMPAMEKDLAFGHDQAGLLFFFLTLGYFFSVTLAGFVSRLATHRGAIVLSTLILAGALVLAGLVSGLTGLKLALVLVGLSAGLYLPSGIASIQDMVEVRHWGKAMAVHELAPNLGFFAVPLLAEALLLAWDWRSALFASAVVVLASGLCFFFFGRASTNRGQPPNPENIRILVKLPAFWIMVILFGLGISSTLGIFSVAPLYLVHEHGLSRALANQLLAGSRVLTIIFAFFAGMMVDRLGAARSLKAICLASGAATVLLGILPTAGVIALVFIQPLLAVMFFPVGFAALGMVGPPQVRPVMVSLTVPPGFLIGGGLVPAGLGYLGEHFSFAAGLAALGVLTMAGALLARALKMGEAA